jgi:hypothetical protein
MAVEAGRAWRKLLAAGRRQVKPKPSPLPSFIFAVKKQKKRPLLDAF